MTMTEQAVPLSTYYKGWGTYQRMLVDMLAPLTDEQLALPAAQHEWTIGMVAQHMVANRVWWFQVWMGEGDPALAPIAHWDPADPVEQPLLTAAELVDGLNGTWAMIQDALDRWNVTDLGQVFQVPAAVSDEERDLYTPVSRQWTIWHVLEHEIHHGGELSLALGAHGLPGIYGDT